MNVIKVSAAVWCLLCMLRATHCGRPYAPDVDDSNLIAKFPNVSVSHEKQPTEAARTSNLFQSDEVQPRHLSNVDPRANISCDRRGSSWWDESLNVIDSCWRGRADWSSNRKQLASCAIGFGSQAVGGKSGEFYVVTNPGDDDVNPAPGTLRYGVIQHKPLWITFATDMTITLKSGLMFTSDKTVDGRGANVHIAYGPCLTIENVENVIVHGVHIHDCKLGRGNDGDGITVQASRNIWIDHNSLSSCFDGLIDVVHASTGVTISNNVFTNHDKVMLLGHSDGYTADRNMRVTVAFNRFGPNLVQRMPRGRYGLFHVVNNDYWGWGLYAIGGSSDPTIISEGNRFQASGLKEVTQRINSGGPDLWGRWEWRSLKNTFVNGAYFVQSGHSGSAGSYGLAATQIFTPSMTSAAGVLSCVSGHPC